MNPAEDRRRAAVFVLVALAILLAFLGTVAGVRVLSREKRYTVEFTESVAGLEVSSAVKYNGVQVGSVESIAFNPEDIGKIRVGIKVRPDVPVKVDTRAALKPQGITGMFFLELYGGTSRSDVMPEGDLIPTDPSFGSSITGIAKNLGELVERLNLFFARNEQALSQAILDIQASAGLVRKTLERVDAMAVSGGKALEEARSAVADVRAEVRATAAAVRTAVGELEAFLKDPALRGLPAKAGEVLDGARSAVARANEVLEGVDVRGVVRKAEEAVAEFRRIEESLQRAADAIASTAENGREDLSAALANIRRASEHAKEIARMLRDDPNRILSGRPATDKAIPEPAPPLPEDKR